MNLDVGCGGGVYGTVPRAEITTSMDYPDPIPPYFVFCDAHYLPFRDKEFEKVYAFNVLEHVKNPYKVLGELKRVSWRTVHLRQDGLFNLKGYATPEHLHFQLPGLRFIPFPRTRIGIAFSKLLRITYLISIPRTPYSGIWMRFVNLVFDRRHDTILESEVKTTQ